MSAAQIISADLEQPRWIRGERGYVLTGAEFSAELYSVARRWKLEIGGIERVFDLGYGASFDVREIRYIWEMNR